MPSGVRLRRGPCNRIVGVLDGRPKGRPSFFVPCAWRNRPSRRRMLRRARRARAGRAPARPPGPATAAPCGPAGRRRARRRPAGARCAVGLEPQGATRRSGRRRRRRGRGPASGARRAPGATSAGRSPPRASEARSAISRMTGTRFMLGAAAAGRGPAATAPAGIEPWRQRQTVEHVASVDERGCGEQRSRSCAPGDQADGGELGAPREHRRAHQLGLEQAEPTLRA